MKTFLSDNNSGVDEKILRGLMEESKRYDLPYGNDQTTKLAKEKLYELLGSRPIIHFTTTGTSANIIGLSSMLMPYEAVIAAETAHINVDECNSLERFNGSKIISVAGKNGKISREDIIPKLDILGDNHASQPKMISISEITEKGTVYTKEEIKDLADFAHENNMYLHVDGARIANALEVLDLSLQELIVDTGVDLLSFGGTKNGMMMGEAIICFRPEFERNLKYGVKQGMQLVSKMRFISRQFIDYLEEDLWLKNASRANEMGRYLARELEQIPGVELVDYEKTNNLFIKMDKNLIDRLSKEIDFYIMDEEEGIIRLITSFNMDKSDIEEVISVLK